MKITNKTAYFSIIFFGLILIKALLVLDVKLSCQSGREVIKISGIDSVCYYDTAHSILFDGDLDLTNEFKNAAPAPNDWTGIQPKTGLPGNPFPIGFSILQVPFLYAGVLFDSYINGQSDGYSKICVTFYLIGVIFYLCVGMACLYRLLKEIGNYLDIPESKNGWSSLLAVFILWPSTSLAYYTFSPMSHVTSFTAVCAFLLVWWLNRDNVSNIGWLGVGFFAGLSVLCAWQNIIFIIVPIVYGVLNYRFSSRGSDENAGSWLFSRITCFAIFFLMLLPQILQWKYIYGTYFLIPQGGDFLQFPPKHIINVLLSSHHGFFIWTPIVLIGIAGLIYGIKRKAAVYVPLTACLVLQIIIVGSVTLWYGPDSFGMRRLIPSLPLIAIGLAICLFYSRGILRKIILFLCISFSLYTMIFALEFRMDMIPRNDRLTFMELITDKIYLNSAWNRYKGYVEARKAFENCDSKNALKLALGTVNALGVDRNLAGLLVEVYKNEMNEAEESKARKMLKDILDSRLF